MLKNLDKTKDPGTSNECITLLISEIHGEYPMPPLPGITIRKEWGGFIAENLINHFLHPKKATPEEMLATFNRVIKHAVRMESIIAYDPNDETMVESSILSITFWKTQGKTIEQNINEYMALLKAAVFEAMNTASGDDTYYDYMPSFVDQYRQLCEFFGHHHITEYNNMVSAWIANEESNEGDPNLYTREIIAQINMQNYTPQQFSNKIQDLWKFMDEQDGVTVPRQIQFFTGGRIVMEHENMIPENDGSMFNGIILEPTHQITGTQLCQIFDEGNHCLSVGHIFYENDYCFYSWSNSGHL